MCHADWWFGRELRTRTAKTLPAERHRNQSSPPGGAAFQTKRTGLASFLFAILRPQDAKSASVTDETVRLMFGKWPLIVPLRDLEEVEVTGGLVWSRLRLRYNSRSARISGLSRKAAAALADAVETARYNWWQRVLASLVETLKPAHDRISALSDPPKYFTMAEMRELELEAQNAAGQVTGHWPKALADAPEIQMLRDTLAFPGSRPKKPGQRPTIHTSPTN